MTTTDTLTPDTYHADTRHVSNSGISKLLKSPAHYYEAYLNPARQPFDTAAFKLGRAFHVACSEPHTFFDRYIVAPGGIDRRTTAGKQRWADFETVAQGKTILQEMPTVYDSGVKSKSLSYEQIMRMRDAVAAHPIAADLLASGRAETPYIWEDYITGAPCKCLTDWEPEGGNYIVDFKSTQDASPEGFRRSIIKYGYDRQAAFYVDGMTANFYGDWTFIFIACETQAPFACELYAIDHLGMSRARDDIYKALALYNKCRESGVWHGYSEDRKVRIITL